MTVVIKVRRCSLTKSENDSFLVAIHAWQVVSTLRLWFVVSTGSTTETDSSTTEN